MQCEASQPFSYFSWWFWFLAVAWLLGANPYATASADVTPFHAMDASPSSLLKELYAPIKIPITSRNITASDGRRYSMSDVIWDKPLKNKVLILDVDTRSFNADGQFLHNGTVPWDVLDNKSAGLFNHYTYCELSPPLQVRPLSKITRYSSRMGKTEQRPQELDKYQFVVFMDADAVWNQLELPLEWLHNHWDFGLNTSLALSEDWGLCTTANGLRCLNTGFIIAQQNERTWEILQAWSGVQFPGCEELNRTFRTNRRLLMIISRRRTRGRMM